MTDSSSETACSHLRTLLSPEIPLDVGTKNMMRIRVKGVRVEFLHRGTVMHGG
jgi:hypothetical protein